MANRQYVMIQALFVSYWLFFIYNQLPFQRKRVQRNRKVTSSILSLTAVRGWLYGASCELIVYVFYWEHRFGIRQ